MLKYPDCEECKFLYSMGVDDNVINRFHENKAKLSALPKIAQKCLKRWRVKMGYVKADEGRTDEADGD